MSDLDPRTHTEDAGSAAAELVRRFLVSVMQGPDAPKELLSDEERLVVGTHESANLRLTDPTVSRFHCELTASDGGVLVRDLGSRNGTLASGVRIREGVVPFGASLVLGHTKIAIARSSDVAKPTRTKVDRFGGLVGSAPSMQRVFSLLERASQNDATVLLLGETGTGKEAAAKSLHESSRRKNGPFVVVDCASVPDNLFEAELFGHEKGSFTGAYAAREGAFEVADGGTLFIDEIGELSLEMQPRLLRVLEQREVKRVGGAKPFPVDVRIVAATHRDLRAEVNAKRFREDLYFRLAVVEVRLPPLRERLTDLSALVEKLAPPIAKRLGVDLAPLATPELLSELAGHSWPGNVRELRNFLERALALGGFDPPVDAATAAPLDTTLLPLREARERAMAAFEVAYLKKLLAEHDDNVSSAARAAGVDRVHIYRMLWRHGLRGRAPK